jgi:hypothetical protein
MLEEAMVMPMRMADVAAYLKKTGSWTPSMPVQETKRPTLKGHTKVHITACQFKGA